MACLAIRKASEGSVIDQTKENSICIVGTARLGLGTGSHTPEHAKIFREFLVHGEKIYSSLVAIHRSGVLAAIKPPLGMAEHVIFAPLDKAELKPDVVVLICNAAQTARLVHLSEYETGLPLECSPTGTLCHSVIIHPLITCKVNVSFGDISARKSSKTLDDELFVTLPYVHLRSVMESIPRCMAGSAKGEMTEGMKAYVKASGGYAPKF
jgi:uncharacterized protein (DUF169 family)